MPHPYGLDNESSNLATQASTLADEVVARHAADVDRSARFPVESLAALGSAGLLGLCVPRELGGLGAGAARVLRGRRGARPRLRLDGDGVRDARRGDAGDRRLDDARRSRTRCCDESPRAST